MKQLSLIIASLCMLLLASCGGGASESRKAPEQKGLSEEEINALFDGQVAPQTDTIPSYDTAFEVEPLED